MKIMDIEHSENFSAIFVADDENSRLGKDGSEGAKLSINASEYFFSFLAAHWRCSTPSANV